VGRQEEKNRYGVHAGDKSIHCSFFFSFYFAAKALPQAQEIKNRYVVPAPPSSNSHTIKSFGFDRPSPDDAVVHAQSGGAGDSAGVPLPIQGLVISDETSPPSTTVISAPSLVDYVPDSELKAACDKAALTDAANPSIKPQIHLVVLGHVDAGKSTLMGRMLFELGRVEEKAVHKAKKEAAAAGKGSFGWAWMLDERPEERARGVTVDVAMSRFETSSRNVVLLDAPGHRDFVPNMISGAAQADAALLVVDGSSGGFESGFALPAPGSTFGGGQTREHAQLARSLGVGQVAVVVTKLDTCGFDQARFDCIRHSMEPFLKSCGFKESSMQWLPAVGPTGENLVTPPQHPALASWYKGPTLAQAIDGFTPPHRLLDRPLRMPVSDVTVKGGNKGTVSVGGKIEGGAMRIGSRIMISPLKEIGIVKSIAVNGHTAAVARAGDSADIAISGIDGAGVHIGSVACHPDFPVSLARTFEAQIVVLDVSIPILKGQQVTLHAHAARGSGHVSRLIAILDGKSGDVTKEKPRCLLKGQTAVVEITTSDHALPLEVFADYKSLGRVALRDGGRTLAVGIVTAVTP